MTKWFVSVAKQGLSRAERSLNLGDYVDIGKRLDHAGSASDAPTLRQRAYHALSMVIAACLSWQVGCSSDEKDSVDKPSTIDTPYKVVDHQQGTSKTPVAWFIAVDVSKVDNDRARKSLRAIAKKLCKNTDTCRVMFWNDEKEAGHVLPMSDRVARSLLASYVINVQSGFDTFLCHPFGPPSHRCVAERK